MHVFKMQRLIAEIFFENDVSDKWIKSSKLYNRIRIL